MKRLHHARKIAFINPLKKIKVASIYKRGDEKEYHLD